jgi:hypothetical protein
MNTTKRVLGCFLLLSSLALVCRADGQWRLEKRGDHLQLPAPGSDSGTTTCAGANDAGATWEYSCNVFGDPGSFDVHTKAEFDNFWSAPAGKCVTSGSIKAKGETEITVSHWHPQGVCGTVAEGGCFHCEQPVNGTLRYDGNASCSANIKWNLNNGAWLLASSVAMKCSSFVKWTGLPKNDPGAIASINIDANFTEGTVGEVTVGGSIGKDGPGAQAEITVPLGTSGTGEKSVSDANADVSDTTAPLASLLGQHIKCTGYAEAMSKSVDGAYLAESDAGTNIATISLAVVTGGVANTCCDNQKPHGGHGGYLVDCITGTCNFVSPCGAP